YLRQEVGNRYAPEAMIAESPRTQELLALVRRVAPSRAGVLIQGESGTGKELVARLLHYWSERVGQPFVAVNCKAFAEGVLESELFGHEKGAFTGAVAVRAGCFERAAGGTLFLDETAEVGRQLAFTPEAEQALVAHAWPGNVRELENAVERAVVLARGATISPEDFLLEAATAAPAVAAGATLQAQLDLSAAGHVRAAL